MNTDGNGFVRLGIWLPLPSGDQVVGQRHTTLVSYTAQQDAIISIGVLLNRNFRWSELRWEHLHPRSDPFPSVFIRG